MKALGVHQFCRILLFSSWTAIPVGNDTGPSYFPSTCLHSLNGTQNGTILFHMVSKRHGCGSCDGLSETAHLFVMQQCRIRSDSILAAFHPRPDPCQARHPSGQAHYRECFKTVSKTGPKRCPYSTFTLLSPLFCICLKPAVSHSEKYGPCLQAALTTGGTPQLKRAWEGNIFQHSLPEDTGPRLSHQPPTRALVNRQLITITVRFAFRILVCRFGV